MWVERGKAGHDKVRDLGIRDRRHGPPFVGKEGRWRKKKEEEKGGKKGKRKKEKERKRERRKKKQGQLP